MRTRGFLILCLATAVMVAAAAAAVITGERPEVIAGAGEKVFPGLLERASHVSTITLKDSGRTLTIDHVEDGWRLREADGYPVREDAVRGAVIALARLEMVEGKTRREDRHAELGVEEVEAAGARSKRITLTEGDGDVLADLVVGKGVLLGEEGGLYVRRPGEARAWLVSGRLDLGLEARDWVERRIIDINPAAVRRITVRHPNGETIVVGRSGGDETLTLESVPDGAEPGPPAPIEDLAAVLSGLELEALAPADEVPLSPDETTSARFEMLDDRVIDVELTAHNGGKWVRLRPEGGDATEKVSIRSGWVYQVPAYRVHPLERPLSDYLALSPPPS